MMSNVHPAVAKVKEETDKNVFVTSCGRPGIMILHVCHEGGRIRRFQSVVIYSVLVQIVVSS